MLKQSQSGEASSDTARLTRRNLLSYALSIGGAGAITAFWPRDRAVAANVGPQVVSHYLVYIGGEGGVVDSLIDMQQIAAPQTQTPADAAARSMLRGPKAVSTQIRIAMGWSPARPFADWVAAAVHVPTPQNGSLFVTDANMNVRAAYNWFRGTIDRIELPPCDATSVTSLSPVLTIQAQQLTEVSASGPPPGNLNTHVRPWRQQNFRLTSTAPIAPSLTRAARVSAIVLGPDIHGGTVDIVMGFGPDRPDLLGPFETALQHGGQLMAQPTDVTLHLLTPNLQGEMATVVLRSCRVMALNALPAPAGTRAIPMTVVKMAFADASLGITPA
jgi:hypothetical protein